jgi:Inhibitor of growth proteins N-terminal histone-binding
MNSTETKADALKNEPIIIRKIKRDYDRIQVLADEKVQIAEQALKLVSKGIGNYHDSCLVCSSILITLLGGGLFCQP